MRVASLDGFKFICHVWVIAVHCFPAISFWDTFMKNLDAGSFFVITGFTSQISLYSAATRLFPPTTPINEVTPNNVIKNVSLNWLRKRLPLMILMGFVFTLGCHLIFPFKSADRHDILPYMLLFLHPFLHQFGRNRENWNPNPPIWFLDNCLWLWLAHALVFGVVFWWVRSNTVYHSQEIEMQLMDKRPEETSPDSQRTEPDSPMALIRPAKNRLQSLQAMSQWIFNYDVFNIFVVYGVMVVLLFVFIFFAQPYATLYTGWSYHWFPRAFQYVFGVWTGAVATSEDCKLLFQNPQLWYASAGNPKMTAAVKRAVAGICSCRWLSLWTADLVFGMLAIIYLAPPRRKDPDWSSVWMWRSMSVTALEAILIVGFIYQVCVQEVSAPPAKPKYDSAEAELLALLEEPATTTTLFAKPTDWFRVETLGTRIWSASWYRKVAPGYTNTVGYLWHFPLVWQPMFDKNTTMRGGRSLLFILVLWWSSLAVNYWLGLVRRHL